MIKVHLGCGPVYLTGYVNVDAPGEHIRLAAEAPELVKSLLTTEDAYYARHEDKTIERLRSDTAKVQGVCDVHGFAWRLPFEERTVDEILARQMFEHLSVTEARSALLEFDRVMRPGGVLRLDVPDVDLTAERLDATRDQFYWRHLIGSRKDDYGYHVVGHTRESLAKLCCEYGFVVEREEPNIHFYPALCLRFRKLPYGRAPWEYVFPRLDLSISDSWRCAEVGPRNFPWPRADEYLDIDSEWDPNNGKPFYVANVHGPLPYLDKEIDFIYVSHVFEHLEDPERAAREISRVAKRGLIVTPHPFKEALTMFDEADHRWLVSAPEDTGQDALVFQPMPQRAKELRDNLEARKAICRIFRNGPAAERDALTLRQWFCENEALLDSVYYWEGNARVVVSR